MEKWKKVILVIITVVISLRIGYIVFRGEVDKEYYTSGEYDLINTSSILCKDAVQIFSSNQDRLNSLEFVFTNIADDKAGSVVLSIYSDEKLIYQTNISLSNINNWGWKKVFINTEISPGKEYKMVVSATEDCTQIPELLVVKNAYAPEIIESYGKDRGGGNIDGQIAVNYGYLRYPSVADRLVMVSLWGFLWMLLFAGLYYFDSIVSVLGRGKDYLLQQVKPQILVTVLELIGCAVILAGSGIEFQAPTRVILYIISLISTVNYTKKIEYISSLIDYTWKKVLIILLYVYAAFALVGQRIWIYPLSIKLTVAGLFVFVCTIFWFIPVVQSILYYMEKVCLYSFTSIPKMKTWKFVAASVLILLLPAVYILFAYNPGISSMDTVVTMVTNAQNLQGMADWHPAFYCMILSIIEKVWNSTYSIIIVQYFFWIYVVLELILYLRKKGIRESILIAVILFTGFNAGNIIHINTIWKDIPYTLSLFWALIIIAKISIDFEKYKCKWYIYLEIIVALVGVCLYRKNGVVSFIIITIPLVFILRKNIRLLAALAISFALILTIKGPVYNYFEVQDTGKHGMYVGLGQDILGVYYAGGEVSASTFQMINRMTDYNNAEYSYNPTWSNQSMDLNVGVKEFVFNYVDTFLKNPIMMMRAIIDRVDVFWDIYAGEDTILGCINYTEAMDGVETWNENYPERKYVSLYTAASSVLTYTATSQWISAIEWRCGLFTFMGLTAGIFLLIKKGAGKYWVIILPLAGHIISLLLSTGWAEFRYFWPFNLLNMAVILLTIVIVENAGERRL